MSKYGIVYLWGEPCAPAEVTRLLHVSDSMVYKAINRAGSFEGAIVDIVARINRKKARQKYPREYMIWTAMLRRCNNENVNEYINYGGRGITVCERWTGISGFYNFINDMGPRPSGTATKRSKESRGKAEWSIDRIDNNKGYSPENCRWADARQQCMNRRSNIRAKIGGESKTLMEWAEYCGLPYHTIVARYKRGDRGEKLIRKMTDNRIYLEVDGVKKTLTEWCQIRGLKKPTVFLRLKNGETPEQALRPVRRA